MHVPRREDGDQRRYEGHHHQHGDGQGVNSQRDIDAEILSAADQLLSRLRRGLQQRLGMRLGNHRPRPEIHHIFAAVLLEAFVGGDELAKLAEEGHAQNERSGEGGHGDMRQPFRLPPARHPAQQGGRQRRSQGQGHHRNQQVSHSIHRKGELMYARVGNPGRVQRGVGPRSKTANSTTVRLADDTTAHPHPHRAQRRPASTAARRDLGRYPRGFHDPRREVDHLPACPAKS